MRRTMTLLVLLVAVLAGCTGPTGDPSPSPSPSATATTPAMPTTSTPPAGRVAVVVSPEPELMAAAAEVGSRSIATGLPAGTDLRVVTADNRSFVRDLTSFFATEGYELVCVLGADAEATVREVARTAPSTRFCAAPARPGDLPPNVLAIDLRVEELGTSPGSRSAPTASGERPAWSPPRRPGHRSGWPAACRPAWPRRAWPGPTVRRVGPVRDAEVVADRVRALLDDGVDGLVSLTGALDTAVRDVVVDEPVTLPAPSPDPTDDLASSAPSPSPTPPDRFASLVAGPEVRSLDDGAEVPAPLLLVLETHLEEAVALAVTRHLDVWDATPATIGMSDGAFRVTVTDSAARPGRRRGRGGRRDAAARRRPHGAAGLTVAIVGALSGRPRSPEGVP